MLHLGSPRTALDSYVRARDALDPDQVPDEVRTTLRDLQADAESLAAERADGADWNRFYEEAWRPFLDAAPWTVAFSAENAEEDYAQALALADAVCEEDRREWVGRTYAECWRCIDWAVRGSPSIAWRPHGGRGDRMVRAALLRQGAVPRRPRERGPSKGGVPRGAHRVGAREVRISPEFEVLKALAAETETVLEERLGLEGVRDAYPEYREAWLDSAFLGVSGGGQAKGSGGQIVSVTAGSAAAGAGLQVGDVIIEIGGAPVSNYPMILEILREYDGGDAVRLKVRRGEATLTIDVELGSKRDILRSLTLADAGTEHRPRDEAGAGGGRGS